MTRFEIRETGTTYQSFDVDAVWKGSTGPEVEVVSDITSCGYRFAEGGRYIVYAWRYRLPWVTFYDTGACTRTTVYHNEEAAALGPALPPGTVYLPAIGEIGE